MKVLYKRSRFGAHDTFSKHTMRVKSADVPASIGAFVPLHVRPTRKNSGVVVVSELPYALSDTVVELYHRSPYTTSDAL